MHRHLVAALPLNWLAAGQRSKGRGGRYALREIVEGSQCAEYHRAEQNQQEPVENLTPVPSGCSLRRGRAGRALRFPPPGAVAVSYQNDAPGDEGQAKYATEAQCRYHCKHSLFATLLACALGSAIASSAVSVIILS